MTPKECADGRPPRGRRKLNGSRDGAESDARMWPMLSAPALARGVLGVALALVVAALCVGGADARGAGQTVLGDPQIGRQAVPEPASQAPHLSLLRLSRVVHRSPSTAGNAFKEFTLSTPADTLRQQRENPSGHSYVHPVVARLGTFAVPPKGQNNAPGVLEERPVLVPDMTDPLTVLSMAYAAWNAYTEPTDAHWKDVPGWNVSAGFGWAEEGIRGYVFESWINSNTTSSDAPPPSDPSIVLIVIKGTSPGAFGVGGPTSPRDKFNDNMMFSCCCAKVDHAWWGLCPCYTGHTPDPDTGESKWTCDGQCLREFCGPAFPDSYYNMAVAIYEHVASLYPNSAVWTAGHSLGGGLASSVALRFGTPSVTFEAPGESLWTSRVNLLPWGGHAWDVARRRSFHESLPIWHVGNDGDPIFLGKCQGATSSCYFGGYALESKCHNGRWCVYELDKLANPPDDGDGDGDGDGDDDDDGDGDSPTPTPTPTPTPDPDPDYPDPTGPTDTPTPTPGAPRGGGRWCWHGWGWCKPTHPVPPEDGAPGNGTDPVPTPSPSPSPTPGGGNGTTPEPPGDPWWRCWWWCRPKNETGDGNDGKDGKGDGDGAKDGKRDGKHKKHSRDLWGRVPASSSSESTPAHPQDTVAAAYARAFGGRVAAVVSREVGLVEVDAVGDNRDMARPASFADLRAALHRAARESVRAALSLGDVEPLIRPTADADAGEVDSGAGGVAAQASLNVNHHRLAWFVGKVLMRWEWEVPACEVQEGGECADCGWWRFV